MIMMTMIVASRRALIAWSIELIKWQQTGKFITSVVTLEFLDSRTLEASFMKAFPTKGAIDHNRKIFDNFASEPGYSTP